MPCGVLHTGRVPYKLQLQLYPQAKAEPEEVIEVTNRGLTILASILVTVGLMHTITHHYGLVIQIRGIEGQ